MLAISFTPLFPFVRCPSRKRKPSAPRAKKTQPVRVVKKSVARLT